MNFWVWSNISNDVDDILHGPHQADHDDDLGVAWRVRLGQPLEMSRGIFEGGNFLRCIFFESLIVKIGD